MQCYNEAGELIEGFRLGFTLDEADRRIVRRVAFIEGNIVEIGRIPADSYLEEISDPFWITDSDHLYINSSFEYATDLREWMMAEIAARGHAEIEIVEIDRRALTRAGFPASSQQIQAFQDGQPIWRRSVFSSSAGQGTSGTSLISKRLRDALLSWVVFCDLFARHAMNAERKNKESKYSEKKSSDITKLAFKSVATALERNLAAPELEISKLIFKKSYQIDAAYQHGRTIYFKEFFAALPRQLSTSIRKEMVEFKKKNRFFDREFDADALVEWSLNILAILRVALAASSDLDSKRSAVRDKMMKENRLEERKRIARLFTIEWLKGIQGVQVGGTERRDVDLEELFDLQKAALIAFAAGVNPRLLFPYISRGIYDDDGELLNAPLFVGAEWLGELFRKRYLQMEYAHASRIVAFCNPERPPRSLPHDRLEEWVTATRMITSFMTETGFKQLMDGAHAVLNDGKTRSVFAIEPSRLRKQKSDASSVLRKSPGIQSDETALLPPPILVEAGWLVLPGDYQEVWVGTCNPFDPGDFAQRFGRA